MKNEIIEGADTGAELENEDQIEYDDKVIALARHLDADPADITDEGDNRFAYYKEEYLVLTDGEADRAWDDELERYIDECILPEIPKYLQSYFDNDKWKNDAQMDGRGHSLSGYDGEENDEKVNGEWYYIYRQN